MSAPITQVKITFTELRFNYATAASRSLSILTGLLDQLEEEELAAEAQEKGFAEEDE